MAIAGTVYTALARALVGVGAVIRKSDTSDLTTDPTISSGTGAPATAEPSGSTYHRMAAALDGGLYQYRNAGWRRLLDALSSITDHPATACTGAAVTDHPATPCTGTAVGDHGASTSTGTAPAFTGTNPTTASAIAFTGTGMTAAGQVMTSTDNQTMLLNECAGMILATATANSLLYIVSNTAVAGAPAVLTVLGTPVTDAGIYHILRAPTPIGAVASHTHDTTPPAHVVTQPTTAILAHTVTQPSTAILAHTVTP